MPIKAGLIPFYLALYDETVPALRAAFQFFVGRIQEQLRSRGIAVAVTGVCRTAPEFAAAVAQCEREGAGCLLTLHLAYSPSLEAIDSFCNTELPLLILDTTMDRDFGLSVRAERIMCNHGIHGVMDFASMLRRRGRPFDIIAGHEGDPSFCDRAADRVRAAVAAGALRGLRALRIGEAFPGMGDFQVSEAVLRERFGVVAETCGIGALDRAVESVRDDEVEIELAGDRARFLADDIDTEAHRRSIRVGLGLRRLLSEGGYGAASINFSLFDSPSRPASTMPFLEISKGMARGIGYAGEGDILTAALVGALARGFDAVTFTEIFCPDWSGNSLFLSHMGEISPSVAAGTPHLVRKPFTFGGGADPVILTCAVRPGPAVFVNLAPGPEDRFSLIVAPVTVLPEGGGMDPALHDTVRAWVRPAVPVPAFLEAYSRAGGTHHSALVLDASAEALAAFGRQLDLEVCVIDGQDS